MNLDLEIFKADKGNLETNISMLEIAVNERLKDYTPERYQGDSDSAKKARAELNSAKKVIASKRIELMKELTKPFLDFETRCKQLEKNILEASGKLDEIVKTKENAEKLQKKVRCMSLWSSLNFDLIPFEKIFSERWLNKTCKEFEIIAEMEEIKTKTIQDLKMIERFASTCDLELETLKALYLECLEIEEVFARGDELVKLRKKAMQEEITRADREREELIAKQRAEIEESNRKEESSCLADVMYGTEPIWNIELSANQDEIYKIKKYIESLNLTCKIEEKEIIF